ncbi:cation diffusion facilitator family transporter [uncultured Cohaesibacter sp.]|uniref:cation diffusion facilitator family transporter n=1 Tax=uncultured Cohaesibacter sp. TaxID=1002546 RepID=UPI0029C768E3|nr:cation diffusion facilitator family transporter [uncultured Cohaesibacter sp.]
MARQGTLFSPKQLAIGSIVVSLLVLGLKYLAYAMTNSVGLYSDALESIVNLAASIAVAIAISLRDKPADHNHPYGHDKAEYISAVLEGVLIVLAALAIFVEASETLLNPRPLQIPILGLVLNAAAGVLNGVWALMLVRYGRKLRSPALVADGKHLFTDVLSSLGILIGITFALLTGLDWLDPLLAFLVAAMILWTGWGLIRNSLGGLMDEAVDEEELEQIQTIIMAHADGAIEAHDLRTRHAGRITFIEFHLVVPSHMTVFNAHEICDKIEDALEEAIQNAHVVIHVEPENKAHEPDADGSMVI